MPTTYVKFLSKSTIKTDITLFEAYIRIQDQRDRLRQLVNTSLVLTEYQINDIQYHIIQLTKWMYKHRCDVEWQFGAPPPDRVLEPIVNNLIKQQVEL